VFKASYANAIALVEKEKLDEMIVASWESIRKLGDKTSIRVEEIDNCLAPLIGALGELNELKESCEHSYSDQQQTLELIERYQIKLNSAYSLGSDLGYKLLIGSHTPCSLDYSHSNMDFTAQKQINN
jgi:hypothetical protein